METASITGIKSLLQQYAAFNLWANQRLLDALGEFPEAQLQQEITSSFQGIIKTLLHMLDAESIWWQRLKLVEHITRPSENFDGAFAEFRQQLLQQSGLYASWVEAANDNQLLHVFAWVKEKEQHKMQVCGMLMHLFNHNSFHRGQIVVMMRQLGCSRIPNTDFGSYLQGLKK